MTLDRMISLRLSNGEVLRPITPFLFGMGWDGKGGGVTQSSSLEVHVGSLLFFLLNTLLMEDTTELFSSTGSSVDGNAITGSSIE